MIWPISLFKKSIETKADSNIRDIDISVDESFSPQQIVLGISSEIPEHISPREAYFMSEKNGDLGSAIRKISSSVANLKPLIQSEDGEKRNKDPFLDILNSPGGGSRKIQFFHEITESFLLTDECWIVARGNINREPLEIVPIRPYDLSIVMNNLDGLPDLITTQTNKDRRNYKREVIKGDIRYIDKMGQNEIFPIIGITNLTDQWRGRSRLIKLFYDVKMNTDGKRHNVSMLKNGMRVSSVVTPTGTDQGGGQSNWNKDTVDTITDYIRAFHQGSGNANNALILSRQAKIDGLTQSNKDMDYISLLGVSRETIYNEFEIPLPLILSDAMTLSNYTVALRAFYNDSVFPTYDNIADGLMKTLGARYKSIDRNDTLTFSDIDIRAMREVLMENAKTLSETNATTTNESRATMGLEADPFGDSILVNSNKVPLESLSITSFEDIEID
jgi:HK97 family phage portal protein